MKEEITMNKIRQCYDRNRDTLRLALLATFLWGILAHAYCFFDNNFSHDSLGEMYTGYFSRVHKIEIGRVFTPIYWDIFRGDMTLPWLAGCLALLWTGLAVFFILKIFRVKNKLTAVLLAGICTANLTVTATAGTYFHDLDSYMFAVACACMATYLWENVHWGGTVGSILIVIAMGIYQCTVFVTITLVIMVCILMLMEGASFWVVLKKGLRALGMLLISVVLYLVALKGMLLLYDCQLYINNYTVLGHADSSPLSELPTLIRETYINWYGMLNYAPSMYSAGKVMIITRLLLLGIVMILGYGCICGVRSWREGFLEIILAALLPLGMYGIYIVVQGEVHELMVYPTWLTYGLALLLGDWFLTKRKCKLAIAAKTVCALMVGVLLWGNVQFANGLYLKKDFEQDAYRSAMTRVLSRIEMVPGYQPGQTPVVFLGGLGDNPNVLRTAQGMEKYTRVVGAWSPDVVLDGSLYFQMYLDYVLENPMVLADEETCRRLEAQEMVKSMPAYPDQGSMVMVDDVLVVKLGDSQ